MHARHAYFRQTVYHFHPLPRLYISPVLIKNRERHERKTSGDCDANRSRVGASIEIRDVVMYSRVGSIRDSKLDRFSRDLPAPAENIVAILIARR